MAYCSLICTPDSFRPTDCSRVRWLDWENDYPLARAYWSQDPPLAQEDWEQNHADGFRYCAIVEQEAIAALAAVWMYSQTHWEVAVGEEVSSFTFLECLKNQVPDKNERKTYRFTGEG